MKSIYDWISEIQKSRRPEDFFAGCTTLAEVRRFYVVAAREVHPDRHNNRAESTTAITLLNEIHDRACAKFARGEWGNAEGATIKAGREYVNVQPLAAGDICDVYSAEDAQGKQVVIKIARSPRDTDLMANEATVLGRLWASKAPQAGHFQKYLPRLVESARLTVGGAQVAANVIERAPRGFTLRDVVAKHGGKLDARHVAWIWKRMLEGIDWVHREGLRHGCLTPDHVLVFPDAHGVQLLDWCYSIAPLSTGGSSLKVISSGHRDYYPPEVLAKGSFTTGADIYMIANCILMALGSDIPPRFGGLIRACHLPKIHRYHDAFELYRELDKHLLAMFGPPKFIPLEM